MKAIKIAVVMILVLNGLFSLYRWMSGDPAQPARQAQVQQEASPPQASEGLDLQALTALVKDIRSGQELERRLNEKGGVNNLDLNLDETVDYIFVSEFGDVTNKVGYSLTVQPAKDETQEVATVTVEKNGDRAEIQVVGNEQIFGPQAIFNDWTKIERENPPGPQAEGYHTSYFHPHPLWLSPFFFGFYPAFFSPFPVMGRTTYVNHVQRSYNTGAIQRGSNRFQSASERQISNPNKGKTANRGIARSLKNPTNTQKKFQATAGNRNLKSGGFGRPGSVTQVSRAPAASSGSQPGPSRKSLFSSSGSNSSSKPFSTGSVCSRSFGSRSFSFGK